MIFMKTAKLFALESKCQKRKVGAVIVDKNKRILSTGYNGTPSGAFECSDYFKVESDHYYISVNLHNLFDLSFYIENESVNDKGWVEVYPIVFKLLHKRFAELYETHAEVNAILNLLKTDTSKPEDMTMYVTCEPCINCRKMIIAAGIKHIVYQDKWDDKAKSYFKLFGGTCEQIQG